MRQFTKKIVNQFTPDRRQLFNHEMASVQNRIVDGDGGLNIRGRYIKDEDRVELLILGEIGQSWWGESISAKEVIQFLGDHRGKDVLAKVDTPGGDVYDGMAIMNGMLDHDGHIKARIMGLCYSAGSFVVLGCDEVEAHETSTYGIHPSWMYCGGNQYQLKDKELWLDSVDRMIMNVYQRKTGMSEKQIYDLFVGPAKDGSVFTATEALEHGFIDSVITLPTAGAGEETETDDDDDSAPSTPLEMPDDSATDTIQNSKTVPESDPAAANVEQSREKLAQISSGRRVKHMQNGHYVNSLSLPG